MVFVCVCVLIKYTNIAYTEMRSYTILVNVTVNFFIFLSFVLLIIFFFRCQFSVESFGYFVHTIKWFSDSKRMPNDTPYICPFDSLWFEYYWNCIIYPNSYTLYLYNGLAWMKHLAAFDFFLLICDANVFVLEWFSFYSFFFVFDFRDLSAYVIAQLNSRRRQWIVRLEIKLQSIRKIVGWRNGKWHNDFARVTDSFFTDEQSAIR